MLIASFVDCIICLPFRFVLARGGASRARPVSRLQQTHPARAEHDAEGGGRLRTGFHSAHQCGKKSDIENWILPIFIKTNGFNYL